MTDKLVKVDISDKEDINEDFNITYNFNEWLSYITEKLSKIEFRPPKDEFNKAFKLYGDRIKKLPVKGYLIGPIGMLKNYGTVEAKTWRADTFDEIEAHDWTNSFLYMVSYMSVLVFYNEDGSEYRYYENITEVMTHIDNTLENKYDKLIKEKKLTMSTKNYIHVRYAEVV